MCKSAGNEADSKDGWGVFHDFRGGVRHRANHSSSKLQEASYDGIKAIGECCQMLEDLTFHDHRMDAGWLAAALSFCANLTSFALASLSILIPASMSISESVLCSRSCT